MLRFSLHFSAMGFLSAHPGPGFNRRFTPPLWRGFNRRFTPRSTPAPLAVQGAGGRAADALLAAQGGLLAAQLTLGKVCPLPPRHSRPPAHFARCQRTGQAQAAPRYGLTHPS